MDTSPGWIDRMDFQPTVPMIREMHDAVYREACRATDAAFTAAQREHRERLAWLRFRRRMLSWTTARWPKP